MGPHIVICNQRLCRQLTCAKAANGDSRCDALTSLLMPDPPPPPDLVSTGRTVSTRAICSGMLRTSEPLVLPSRDATPLPLRCKPGVQQEVEGK